MIEVVVLNEQGIILELKERLSELFPTAEKIFIRRDFPDVLIHLKDGKTLAYEIEYKLSNFFTHGHDHDERKCHGIIFWINDIIEAKIRSKKLKKYELIYIGKQEIYDMSWIDKYLYPPINEQIIGSDRYYSVSYVMERLKVTRQTVYKWLEAVIIPNEDWFRLPKSRHIRIKGTAIKKLENREI